MQSLLLQKKKHKTHTRSSKPQPYPSRATLAWWRETSLKKPNWRVGGNRPPAVSMEISNLIIQLPWRAQTEPSKVIIYYISHQTGVCEPVRESQWVCERVAQSDRKSEWIHSSVYCLRIVFTAYADWYSLVFFEEKDWQKCMEGRGDGWQTGYGKMNRERRRRMKAWSERTSFSDVTQTPGVH